MTPFPQPTEHRVTSISHSDSFLTSPSKYSAQINGVNNVCSHYPEPFDGYFGVNTQLHEDRALNLPLGEDTASEEDEDEDEEPKVRWAFSYKSSRDGLPRRERHRSWSACGIVSSPSSPTISSPWTTPSSCDPCDGLATPMSRASSMLISPALDGTVTTPPPSSRVSCSPRRRHHSCVAPNTKEFKTLATIFGWVTDASANYSHWPARLEDQEQELGQQSMKSILDRDISSSRYFPNTQGANCTSDDDSDLDDCHHHTCPVTNCCVQRESRTPEFSQKGIKDKFEHNPQSSNGSIEFLNESNEGSYGASMSWSSSSKCSLNNWRIETPGSESSYSSETTPSSSIPVPQIYSATEYFQGDHHSHTIAYPYQVPSPDSITTNEHLISSPTTAPSHRTGRELCRSDDMSIRYDSYDLSSPLDPEQLESSFMQCSGSTVISPLPCSHSKDPGYISFLYNKHDQPLESLDASMAQKLDNTARRNYICSKDISDKAAQTATFNASNTGPSEPWSNNPSNIVNELPVPPPIPPRYPEIDLRVFDHPENESAETIVYAPFEDSSRESSSNTHEPRPIIAATIVKLIEKLTHQYGLDYGFMVDFFLTYRLFMSPVQLCKYLIQRYLWALEEDTGFRHAIRIRTFVVFRFWINTHFADDFLTSKSLRFQMASFLNEMRFNTKVQTSPRDSRIIRSLMDFFKYQRRYYKGLAQQSADAEKERYIRQHKCNSDNGSGHASYSIETKKPSSEVKADQVTAAAATVEVADRPRVSILHRQVDSVAGKMTTSDVTETINAPNPTKGRHRAYTLGGMTTKLLSSETTGKHGMVRPSSQKEQRPVYQLGRQASEGGGVFLTRERRLSSSSIRSTSTWSTKFVNKIRQKSEDLYQQYIHPSGSQHKADSKYQCVCWTLAYAGISEHHALNTARSFPNLRPSAISSLSNHNHQQQQQQDTVGSGVGSNVSGSNAGLPSNKSIKRLKSTLSLGLHSTSNIPSPIPSPTRNQFSGISSRHSRSNSSSSVGYHPNPECPYHTPCIEAIQVETATLGNNKVQSESSDNTSVSAACTTLIEALQEDRNCESGPSSSSQPQSNGNIVLSSPVWNYGPWHSSSHQNFPNTTLSPLYKPFILFYRSQLIAQQLCLLEQHFLENVRWDELLEVELCRAGRKSRSKVQSSISGYLFRAEGEPNGMDASNERSNMLCMWVASEVVSTRDLEDRVRVIEKFIRIAQKCYQYRNFNSLMQLVMGLGSSPLCGLRRTWARVSNYEMRILHDLQEFISPFRNWSELRKAMNQVGFQETSAAAVVTENGQRLSVQGAEAFASSIQSAGQDTNGTGSSTHTLIEPGHSKYLQYQAPLDKQGCIPFLGLFVFDLTHIAVSPSWFLPHSALSTTGGGLNSEDDINTTLFQNGVGSVPSTLMKANHMATAAHLVAPEPKDLQDLMSTGTLLVHFYRYQLIAKTIKWFMAFQQRSPKYTFPVDSTLYSKCFLLRVLTKERVKELAIKCESE
ncbi:hypothetical protein FBU30_006586 [Linnemannia zychae]|nr:hypothetical protein FBU30_006586 [Linnemannia zychae]